MDAPLQYHRPPRLSATHRGGNAEALTMQPRQRRAPDRAKRLAKP